MTGVGLQALAAIGRSRGARRGARSIGCGAPRTRTGASRSARAATRTPSRRPMRHRAGRGRRRRRGGEGARLPAGAAARRRQGRLLGDGQPDARVGHRAGPARAAPGALPAAWLCRGSGLDRAPPQGGDEAAQYAHHWPPAARRPAPSPSSAIISPCGSRRPADGAAAPPRARRRSARPPPSPALRGPAGLGSIISEMRTRKGVLIGAVVLVWPACRAGTMTVRDTGEASRAEPKLVPGR